MTVSLTSIRIIIPDTIGLEIIQAKDPLELYRQHLQAEHNIDPKTITPYDVDQLRRGCIVALGEKALRDIGLPVPAEKD